MEFIYKILQGNICLECYSLYMKKLSRGWTGKYLLILWPKMSEILHEAPINFIFDKRIKQHNMMRFKQQPQI